MLSSIQVTIIIILSFMYVHAVAPPGYVKPKEDPDKNPPKYEYGYNIGEKGTSQGKSETRDGVEAEGRYYVEEKEANSNVQYYADDWGYHPFVQYSNKGPHSRASTQLLLGTEAIKKFRDGQDNRTPKQQIAEAIDNITRQQKIRIEPQQETETTNSLPTTTVQQSTQTTEDDKQTTAELSTIQTTQSDELSFEGQVRNFLQGVLTEGQVQETTSTGQELTSTQEVQTKQTTNQADSQTENLIESRISNQENNQPHTVYEFTQQDNQIQAGPQNLVPLQDQQTLLFHHPLYSQVFLTSSIGTPQPDTIQTLPTVTFGQPLYQNLLFQYDTNQGALDNVQNIQNQQQTQEFSKSSQNIDNAALFQSSQSSSQQSSQQESSEIHRFNDAALQHQFIGGFGSRINIYPTATPSYISENTVHHAPSKLIQSTKNLVSGQDVLNINDAVGKTAENQVENISGKTVVSESFSKSQQQEASSSTILQKVEVNGSGVKLSTTLSPPYEQQKLSETPIFLENIQETGAKSATKISVKTENHFQSSTASSVEASSSGFSHGTVTEPSDVLVTPRPVSSNFLAPITAGIQLQNVEYNSAKKNKHRNENVFVEIQKSVPFYLGKFEYPSAYAQEQSNLKKDDTKSVSMKKTALENIELGKTLLYLPGEMSLSELKAPQQSFKIRDEHKLSANSTKEETKTTISEQQLPKIENNEKFSEVNNYLNVQQLPSDDINEQFTENDQQLAQGYHYQVAVQQLPLEKPVLVPVEINKIAGYPFPIQYAVNTVAQHPVSTVVQQNVGQQAPVQVTLEKIVEKHIPVSHQYHVENIVSKPVHIPVEATKFVEKPLPIEISVPQPIIKHQYPVHAPVEVKVPVEKVVEKPVHIPHYIERPIPVQKVVEKPVVQYLERPHPVEVKVPVHVPQTFVLPVDFTKHYPLQYPKSLPNFGFQPQQYIFTHNFPQIPIQKLPQQIQQTTETKVVDKFAGKTSQNVQKNVQQSQSQGYYYPNPYSYAPTHLKTYIPPKKQPVQEGYLPPKRDQKPSGSYRNIYFTIKPDDYIGLIPPKIPSGNNNQQTNYRKARSNFNNLRIEYGFMPPLIPSMEIDEMGNPIHKPDE